jgi:hypothetical protein
VGRFVRVGFAVGAVWVAGCDRDALFRVTGFQQETFSNDADVLFVIDNSTSMAEEASALALNFGAFVDRLAGDESTSTSDGLVDAVDNYIDYSARRTSFIDYQLAIVSTDPADVGALRGEMVQFGEDDVAARFSREVMCEATCWTAGSYGNDPSYQCGEPYDEVTSQVLDCECGADGWGQGANCGGGNEEGLEQVFLALCRAVPNPPESCFDPDNSPGFTPDLVGSSDGLVRDGSTVIPVLVTDEGDASRRFDGFGDAVPDEYDRLFRQFDARMAWALIGPQPGNSGQNCNSVSVPDWSVARYEWFVEETNGLRLDIAEDTGDGCGVTDFEAALSQLGDLLNALAREFRLQAVPELDTLLVFVDGEPVEAATLGDDNEYGDGWSYDPSTNAVVFHGAAVPDYEQPVAIYYLPLTGMPRELPF